MDIKELYQLYRQHPIITTDTRDCPEGSIFIALKGASFNGNQFAQQALDKGCAYAIVDEAACCTSERTILVDDCLQTFKNLAREHRRQFGIPVIGITGTNGKTTTKELISAVLSQKFNVLYTLGNFNNDVGVPKTLMRLTSEHEIAVIEMGANHPGDIKTLVETVEPTHGLITNVGRAHLQGFGSFEGVKRTKGELYDYLASTGAEVFLNAGSSDLKSMASERNISGARMYGIASSVDALDKEQVTVTGEVVECAPTLTFRWIEQDMVIRTHLIGTYNLDNMLAAITVGLEFGVPATDICKALEGYVPSNNRSQLTVTPKNQLVVDAYNANPTSMTAAINNFRAITTPLHKMAILGSMGELGSVSEEEHRKIVSLLDECWFDVVWLVGSEFAKTSHSYRQFQDVEEVKAAIAAESPEGCMILVKGSNSQKLFQLPELL